MDFNEILNSLTWKKIMMTVLVVLLGIGLIREFIFLDFFHEAKQLATQFENQFNQQQKEMHDKLSESERDFDKIKEEFDMAFKKDEKRMAETRQKFQETMSALEKQSLEREKKFNELFAEAPKEMLRQQQEMGEKMFEAFQEESADQTNYFKNHRIQTGKSQKN